jgi:exodeoxyribonuclease VII large subunit
VNGAGASQPRVWGVRELLNYITRRIERDEKLADLGVRGEVTNLSKSVLGHVYFSLKEPSGASLRCFVRSAFARDLPELTNGVEATAYGALGLYPGRGDVQLTVTAVMLVGGGKLAAVYERIKRKLEAEGLFDPARKRTIPRYPFRVALISSPEAEGARDFWSIVAAKAPAIALRLFATQVQGVLAPAGIAEAVARAARSKPDVIAVVRGGGSDDDRLPFNEEIVARAIANAPVAVVTAIGHRADHHIADDVADASFATPTAAAEALVAGFVAYPRFIGDALGRARGLVAQRIGADRERLRRLGASPYLRGFERLGDALAQRVDRLAAAVASRHAATVHRHADRLRTLERRLAANDPSARLAVRRGRLRSATAAMDRAWTVRANRAERDAADAARGLTVSAREALQRLATRAALLEARLSGKDPEAILQQGYAIVRLGDRVLREALQVRSGETIEARLWRGTIRARVEETRADG